MEIRVTLHMPISFFKNFSQKLIQEGLALPVHGESEILAPDLLVARLEHDLKANAVFVFVPPKMDRREFATFDVNSIRNEWATALQADMPGGDCESLA